MRTSLSGNGTGGEHWVGEDVIRTIVSIAARTHGMDAANRSLRMASSCAAALGKRVGASRH
jgi:hypothetical protein